MYEFHCEKYEAIFSHDFPWTPYKLFVVMWYIGSVSGNIEEIPIKFPNGMLFAHKGTIITYDHEKCKQPEMCDSLSFKGLWWSDST